MTPTLLGRWQTRLLLLATVGVLVTLPFAVGLMGNEAQPLLWVLGYVALFGIFWDVLYTYLQKFRWDRDWPAAFQLLAGIGEGFFIALIIKLTGLPGIPQQTPLTLYLLHYALVWVAVFTVSQTLMRVLFPRSRFRGGQWL